MLLVKCPFCGSLTNPEIDEAGTRYPCCGEEQPNEPSCIEVEWTAKPVDVFGGGYVIEIEGEPLFSTKESVYKRKVGEVIEGFDIDSRKKLKLQVTAIEVLNSPDSFRPMARGRGIAKVEPFSIEQSISNLKALKERMREKILGERRTEMVKKVVTHTRPGHTDDILAVALLSQKYPDAEIRFVHPQSKELEELRERDDVILVDVGGDYNPRKRNYDHHQDIDGLPFSLILVLQNEFPEYWEVINKNPLLKQSLEVLDYKDRYGVVKAEEITGLNPLPALFLEEAVVKPLGETPEGIRTLGKALKEKFEKDLDLMRKLESVEVRKINGLTVLVDRNALPVNLILSEYGQRVVDLIVQKNSRNPEQTSVIRNSMSEKVNSIEPSRLKDEAVFVHPNGFMAVLPEPIDKVAEKLEQVVEKIHVKKTPIVNREQEEERSRRRSR